MKNIYIVLTYTGTILSKIVKLYTRKKYSHISVGLDEHLKVLCSFGRIYPYNPFLGGFVREGVDRGTFKRFKNTQALIFRKEVTDEQYKKLKTQIKYFEKNASRYKFNVIGLFAVSLNKRIYRKDYFYCAEFVKYVLEKSNIENQLPEIIKPEDFLKINGLVPVYEGKLRDYNKIFAIECEKEKQSIKS